MHYISANVKKLMEVTNISLSELARRTGVSKATISRWFNEDKTPRLDMIEKIATVFDLPLDYFIDDSFTEYWKLTENGWVGKVDPDNEPVYDIAAGPGRKNTEYPDEYISSDGNYSFAKVHGESMLPELRDGDIVKVEETTNVDPKDFAVVRIDGEDLTIKHVEWTDEGLWLRAENKDVFKDRFYSVKEISTLPVQVIGKAVEVRRAL